MEEHNVLIRTLIGSAPVVMLGGWYLRVLFRGPVADDGERRMQIVHYGAVLLIAVVASATLWLLG
jgi:hypothetical protein